MIQFLVLGAVALYFAAYGTATVALADAGARRPAKLGGLGASTGDQPERGHRRHIHAGDTESTHEDLIIKHGRSAADVIESHTTVQ